MDFITGIGTSFCLIGAGLSVIAVRHFLRRLAFFRTSSVAPGVIVALREEHDGMETQSFRYPRIRFRTASGQEVTFESEMARGGHGWRVGDSVSIRYRDTDPEVAEIDGFLTLWGASALFAVLAVVFLSLGSAILLGFLGEL